MWKNYLYFGRLKRIPFFNLKLQKVSRVNTIEKKLLEAVRGGSNSALGDLYTLYAKDLLSYAYGFTKDRQLAEDIVHEVFLSLWHRRENLPEVKSIKSYLLGAVKLSILSYIRREKVHQKYEHHFLLTAAQSYNEDVKELIDNNDLLEIIENALEQLPPKCREAFKMSRFEQLSIPEIAEAMNISTRTVENYITRALAHLREHMSKLLPVYLLLDIFDFLF